jgi:hypothetical protein
VTQEQLPPAPVFPPLEDKKEISAAINGAIAEVRERGLAQFDHLVESHSGFWHLGPEKRWAIYTQGPLNDFQNLQQRMQQQEQAEQQYQQAVQQQQAEAQGPPKSDGTPTPPKKIPDSEVIQPPLPLMTPVEIERMELYERGEDPWYVIWLLALTRIEPTQGEKMMRDYASLSLRFAKGNGHAQG